MTLITDPWKIHSNMPHLYNSSTISWRGEVQVNKPFTTGPSNRTDGEKTIQGLSSHNHRFHYSHMRFHNSNESVVCPMRLIQSKHVCVWGHVVLFECISNNSNLKNYISAIIQNTCFFQLVMENVYDCKPSKHRRCVESKSIRLNKCLGDTYAFRNYNLLLWNRI